MDAAALRAALKKIEAAVSWYRALADVGGQTDGTNVDSRTLLVLHEATEAQLKILEEGK